MVLDNIKHHQSSWPTCGAYVAEIGLHAGCDDIGSTMMEENVVSAAGCTFAVPISEMERLITDAGYTPARRNTRYERV